MSPTYNRLVADLSPVGRGHDILRIEHPMLVNPLYVTASFAPDVMTWQRAMRWANELVLGGFTWRLPTVEEALFIPNRANSPAFDPSLFMGARPHSESTLLWSRPDRGPWIWTATLHAKAITRDAWVVDLAGGGCYVADQSDRGHALAVIATPSEHEAATQAQADLFP